MKRKHTHEEPSFGGSIDRPRTPEQYEAFHAKVSASEGLRAKLGQAATGVLAVYGWESPNSSTQVTLHEGVVAPVQQIEA